MVRIFHVALIFFLVVEMTAEMASEKTELVK